MPQHASGLKEQVEEVLDLELINQEVNHGCFNLEECAKFIIIVMGKLCAPQRDDELNKLKETKGIVSTLRLVNVSACTCFILISSVEPKYEEGGHRAFSVLYTICIFLNCYHLHGSTISNSYHFHFSKVESFSNVYL